MGTNKILDEWKTSVHVTRLPRACVVNFRFSVTFFTC